MALSISLPIRHRLSIATAILLLMVICAAFFLGMLLYNQKHGDFEDAYLKGQKNLWDAITLNESNAMSENFKTFTRNRKLTSALFKNEKDKLRDLIGPSATRLKASGIASNLMVVMKDGSVGFSETNVSQAPETAKTAMSSKKLASGLEYTADGRLVNVVAFPILDRADLVGVGVFEKNLDDAVIKMQQANSRDAVIFDMSDKLHASTVESQPDFGINPEVSGNYREINADGITLGIAETALRNSDGEQIARLLTFSDVSEQAAARNQTLIYALGGGVVLLLILTAGMNYYMKTVLSPLGKGVSYMQQIAAGDLTVDIECSRNDEFKDLLDAMNIMNVDLKKLVSNVAGTVNEVANTIGHVQQASEQTNQNVSKQRVELEQLATALNQMSATANEVANNIASLADSAEDSKQSSSEGDRLVKASVQNISTLTEKIRHGGEAVKVLEEKSNSIGVVLEVIKNIAEQTNLLALNAAIEAARAGESGRGFAVVADEVRTLATRTQDSATEIEEIISAVQSGVSEAVEVMNQSVDQAVTVTEQSSTINQALDSINAQIANISQLSVQVAAASEQQRSATEEMNRNITNISDMADSTASQSNDFTRSVDDLKRLSDELLGEMGRFKLN